jgi:hypothetical protein
MVAGLRYGQDGWGWATELAEFVYMNGIFELTLKYLTDHYFFWIQLAKIRGRGEPARWKSEISDTFCKNHVLFKCQLPYI